MFDTIQRPTKQVFSLLAQLLNLDFGGRVRRLQMAMNPQHSSELDTFSISTTPRMANSELIELLRRTTDKDAYAASATELRRGQGWDSLLNNKGVYAFELIYRSLWFMVGYGLLASLAPFAFIPTVLLALAWTTLMPSLINVLGWLGRKAITSLRGKTTSPERMSIEVAYSRLTTSQRWYVGFLVNILGKKVDPDLKCQDAKRVAETGAIMSGVLTAIFLTMFLFMIIPAPANLIVAPMLGLFVGLSCGFLANQNSLSNGLVKFATLTKKQLQALEDQTETCKDEAAWRRKLTERRALKKGLTAASATMTSVYIGLYYFGVASFAGALFWATMAAILVSYTAYLITKEINQTQLADIKDNQQLEQLTRSERSVSASVGRMLCLINNAGTAIALIGVVRFKLLAMNTPITLLMVSNPYLLAAVMALTAFGSIHAAIGLHKLSYRIWLNRNKMLAPCFDRSKVSHFRFAAACVGLVVSVGVAFGLGALNMHSSIVLFSAMGASSTTALILGVGVIGILGGLANGILYMVCVVSSFSEAAKNIEDTLTTRKGLQHIDQTQLNEVDNARVRQKLARYDMAPLRSAQPAKTVRGKLLQRLNELSNSIYVALTISANAAGNATLQRSGVTLIVSITAAISGFLFTNTLLISNTLPILILLMAFGFIASASACATNWINNTYSIKEATIKTHALLSQAEQLKNGNASEQDQITNYRRDYYRQAMQHYIATEDPDMDQILTHLNRNPDKLKTLSQHKAELSEACLTLILDCLNEDMLDAITGDLTSANGHTHDEDTIIKIIELEQEALATKNNLTNSANTMLAVSLSKAVAYLIATIMLLAEVICCDVPAALRSRGQTDFNGGTTTAEACDEQAITAALRQTSEHGATEPATLAQTDEKTTTAWFHLPTCCKFISYWRETGDTDVAANFTELDDSMPTGQEPYWLTCLY